ncbi:MAG: glycogen synthase GlgA [Clostridia bacterium]|nr:glycogen synthase GlgA [Clostridia bacterium]
MKVLFAASEAYPFAMSGGLADVAGSLPKALRKRLVGCRVVMPLYSDIPEELKANMNFITHITVPVAWRRQYCGIFEARVDGVIYYLLDNQYYFKRDGLYGFYDDAERYAFFSRAVLEILPHINFKPDIIHCNDWQSAMTPVYLDRFYCHDPFYTDIKTVFTIHNIQYQGQYGTELLGDVLGLSGDDCRVVEYGGCVNMLKGGIECADRVTTVSPTYAGEILTPEFAHGLDGILRDRSFKLCGIINGIDTDVYNPETDKNIYENYTVDTIEKKAVNKAKLQERMGLPVRDDVPMIGIVSRLVGHKGFDIVKQIFEEVLKADVQFCILGSGEWEFETFFHEMSQKYPDKVAIKLGFVPELARKIYAGADLFLMPSKSEPCGLSQLIALRYGTVPIVRETGGLNDTIKDSGDGVGNGFTFSAYDAGYLLHCIWRAVGSYADKEGFNILRCRAMGCDNSWGRSANEYIKLYKSIKR